MRKLVIDRSIWLRGEGLEKSKLVRSSDGKQCCVGIYLIECGVDKDAITDIPEPRSFTSLPEEAEWLREKRFSLTQGLFEANDAQGISAETREKEITGYFRRQGVEVTFVDGPSTRDLSTL